MDYTKPLASVKTLEILYAELGEQPVITDEDGDTVLENNWRCFDSGTDVQTIWHWLEAKNPMFSIAAAGGLGHHKVHVVSFEGATYGGFFWHEQIEEADKTFAQELADAKGHMKEDPVTLYQFECYVSSLDNDKVTAELEDHEGEMLISADTIYGDNEAYKKDRENYVMLLDIEQ